MKFNFKSVLNYLEASFQILTDYLGIDHIQGQGRLIASQKCPVTFDVIIPNNLEQSPYILWVSIGEHNHVPPPVHKVSKNLRQDIINLFVQMNNPNLTISKKYFQLSSKLFLN